MPLQVNTAPQFIGKGTTRKRVKPSTMVFRVKDMSVTGELGTAAAVTGLFASTDHGETGIAVETSADSAGNVTDECGSAVVLPAKSRAALRLARPGIALLLRHCRIEGVEQDQAGEETANMGLPGDLLPLFGDRQRAEAEQRIQSDPHREEDQKSRLAERSE